MCTRPWCTTRFSPRFLKVLRGAFFPPSPFFSGAPPEAAAASVFAMLSYSRATHASPLHCLLFRDRALARALARARVADRQVAAVPEPSIAADFHQPLDVHRDLLAQIAFHAADLFDHTADLADVVFGEILDANVRTDAGRTEDVARPLSADAVDIREPDLDALGAREITACNTRHRLSLPLLVLCVRADHSHHSAAADDFALVADPLD